MRTKVEVQIDDKCVAVWFKGRMVFRLWATTDGQGHAHCPNTEILAWDENTPPMSGLAELEVHALRKERDTPMALPRLASQRIEADQVFKPAEVQRSRSSSGGNGSLITSNIVQMTVNAIIDGYLSHPAGWHDDKTNTARESQEIAKTLNIGVGSVAAVRANLTRGRYGDLGEMIATRKHWLLRNDPERARSMAERR